MSTMEYQVPGQTEEDARLGERWFQAAWTVSCQLLIKLKGK